MAPGPPVPGGPIIVLPEPEPEDVPELELLGPELDPVVEPEEDEEPDPELPLPPPLLLPLALEE